MIKPRTRCPDLDLPTLDGPRFTLAERHPRAFTLLVFYRGVHCPICKTYLRDLDRKVEAFAQRGVDVVALSTDGAERAVQAKRDWELQHVVIAYDLTIDKAREWGLYVSRAIKDSEPPLFAEPGLFLIQPDGLLYCASIQSMPFARPSFNDVLQALDFIREKNYPPRGEA